jgi:iron complex transport system ATP-binding protein
MLSCHNLTLQVPGRVLCRDVSVTLEPGQVWAFLGRNGCGKTTLVHALAGLDRAVGAAVELDGGAFAGVSRRSRARAVGVLLQHEEAEFWGSVFEYVLLGRYPHSKRWHGFDAEDEARAERALETVELASFSARRYTTLSGGERQRARIAQLLAQEPRVFLLDEPLQHLDLKHQVRALELFRRLARDERRAVAMVLHDLLWPARCCTHALLMHHDGTVAAGTASGLLTRENLERLYGTPLVEVRHGGFSYFVPHV